jgi:hypothetical protein
MSYELAQQFRFVDFFPVPGADHVNVLTLAREKIIESMNTAP